MTVGVVCFASVNRCKGFRTSAQVITCSLHTKRFDIDFLIAASGGRTHVIHDMHGKGVFQQDGEVKFVNGL